MVDKGRFGSNIHFKYKTELRPTKSGMWVRVPKPKLEIIFRKFAESKDPEKNREIKFNALIDSGADYSFFPLEIANMLRLDIDQSDEKISTIIGETTIFKSKVHVEIPIYKKRPVVVGMVETFVMPHEIQGKRTPEDFIILGRKDFFEKFQITFNESMKTITLKEFRKPIDTERPGKKRRGF